MPQISQVLDHRLQDVTIHTSQTTMNRAGEWVSHHIADAPDLMAVAWDVWDNAKADTESALAAAFEQAKEWLQDRPLTPDLEDGFYAAFDQHLLDVDFDNWAVINRVDTTWFTQEDYSNWEQSGAGPEGLTECLPHLHLGRPYESGPEGPATHIRAYAFPELPVGALLTYLAANRRVDLPPPPPRNSTEPAYADVYRIVREQLAEPDQIIASDTNPDLDELTWAGLYNLIAAAYGESHADTAGNLIDQLTRLAHTT